MHMSLTSHYALLKTIIRLLQGTGHRFMVVMLLFKLLQKKKNGVCTVILRWSPRIAIWVEQKFDLIKCE